MGKVGLFLHRWDITLSDTKFGKFLSKVFKFDIDPTNSVKTGRIVPKLLVDPKTGNPFIGQIKIRSIKIEGKPLAKVIGRALLRIPIISLGILGILELPNLIKQVNKAHGAKNKLKAAGKQGTKSIINVISIQAGISLIGVLLARKGPAYSLIGMGIGSVAGAYASKKLQNGIYKLTDKK